MTAMRAIVARSDTIGLTFLKAQSSCSVENGF